MRPPDIALVTPYPNLTTGRPAASGVASYAQNLARHLAADGTDVVVMAPREDGEDAVADDKGVRVVRPYARGAAALPVAVRAARETGARLVHLQFELFLFGGKRSLAGLPIALSLLRSGDTRSVVTLHQVVRPRDVDGSFTRMHRMTAPRHVARAGLAGVQGTISRLSDAVVVHEHGFADIVRRARVIPHGVEFVEPPDRETARAHLGLDRFTALCFGFIAPYKGLELALEAARRAGDEVDLVVAGGAHPRVDQRDGYASRLAARWGDAARFTGYVPPHDVSHWFAAADIVLLPYPMPHGSSGPLALALGHGTPFLMSQAMANATGAPDAVVLPDDPDRLASLLVELSRSAEQLDAIAAASSPLAADRSWPDVATAHLNLYEEVIDGDRAPDRTVRTSQSRR